MFRPAQYFAFVSSLAVVALVGCNSVLGIDEAHLSDGASSPSNSSNALAIPIVSCQAPASECAACLASASAYTKCVSNQACRKALDRYRACLGDKCNDVGCFDALSATAASEVADYVRTECSQCAGQKPLASMCELYCRCMQQQLPGITADAAPDGATCETAAAAPNRGSACITACEMLAATDPASVHCRWSHCELAVGGESRTHCLHAIDSSICPLKVVAGDDCKNRSLPHWACDDGNDCCSSSCSNHFCE